MASSERNISGVSRGTSSVDARLTGLEEEAARLRAEIAALQDEIRWLTGEDDGDRGGLSDGWLARGWVRASMLMAVVGLVAFVSVPYIVHLFDASTHRSDPAAAVGPAEAGTRSVTRAPASGTAEYIPAPARVRSADVPAPAYLSKRPPASPRGEPR
jgi:hypothetical protein